MLTKLKKLFSWLPTLSARFHIAFGLCSLVTSVVLLAMFTGFVPDRDGALQQGRMSLAEAVASGSSILLKRGDLPGVRGSLEFIVERNPHLHAIELYRASNNSRLMFGDPASVVNDPVDSFSSLGGNAVVSVPILRGDREWGQLHFQFASGMTDGWLDRIRQSAFSLMVFMGLICLPLFYFYLGKMLKELNPSTAVPARVRSALDTIAECLMVIDGRGNIVLANAAFSELTGRPAEDMIGQHAENLDWLHDDATNPSYPWQTAFEGAGPTRVEMVGFLDSNGETRKFNVNCSPVTGAKGKVGGVLVSMDDVTQLEEKEMLLRQSMEEAEAANQAKTAFMSNMSHEIRTPMTAILGFTEVLKRGFNQTEQDRLRHLNTISNSGTHLLELINDVLDLSKVESGAMEVESIPTPCALIANEVVHVLGVKAREKGVAIEIELESDLPEHIISDPSRLRQIITNLVGNAIKFTEKGRVSVSLEYQDTTADPRMLIRVRDTGIGMSEKQLSTIFDAFTQADASITRRFGGTGLGLSISRKLANAMGGDIVVTSEQGVGSTFMITLPVGDIAGVKVLSPHEVRESFDRIEQLSQQQWVFPDVKALVVDDAPENRELLALVLGDLGIDVVTAENGKEGVDAVLADAFDVVLMDIQMPVMDGYQAVSLMREKGVQLPIVALTANAMKGFEKTVLDAGFSHYMTKPIDLDRLTELLAELLGGHSQGVATPDAAVVQHPAGETVVSVAVSSEPIYSTLMAGNPKFVPIVRQFVERLDDQLEDMRAAIENAQWDELAKLAHWLKGSGGTVGFHDFKEPATELEMAGKSADADAAAQQFTEICALRSRLAVDAAPESIASPAATLGHVSNSSIHAGSVTKDDIDTRTIGGYVDNPVVSVLPMHNARFRGIVGRFLPKLDQQLEELQKSLDAAEFETIAQIAHWLKGSGGNVGFDELTVISAALEQNAKNRDMDGMKMNVEALANYIPRIHAGWDQLPPLDKTA